MAEVPEHFYRQSAVLPYRWHRGRLEILMVTSRRKKRWVIPKGVQEPGLSAAQSAAKEAEEEAGILGEVGLEPLGSYSYDKWGGVCTVEVYPMAVETCLDEWPENFRDRQWVSPQEAASRAQEPQLREIIRAFADALH